MLVIGWVPGIGWSAILTNAGNTTLAFYSCANAGWADAADVD
jgi:hypothetical protein